MPNLQLFPEFRVQYELTKYPFIDTATLKSDTGQTIDHDLFEDASFYPIGNTGLLYISSIKVATRLITINIADAAGNSIAGVEFDPLFAPDLLKFTDAFGRPAGVLLSSSLKLNRFTGWAITTHTFRPEATTIVPSNVIPTPEVGVRGIRTTAGDLFVGDFLIVGDNGVVVREEDPGCIRVDIVGEPLFRRELCSPIDLFTTPRFIKTINGCAPDQYGNFNLTVGDQINGESILRIYNTTRGLVIGAAGATVEGPEVD